MTSIGFGDITPLTDGEKGLSLFVMIIGASTYAGLFGTFVNIIDGLNAQKRELKGKVDQAKQWIRVRNLSDEIKTRLIAYYTIIEDKFSHIQKYSKIKRLSLSL
jgi:NADH dehydrogenase/NADH:ubiquinone oxidoreductase subunit G